MTCQHNITTVNLLITETLKKEFRSLAIFAFNYLLLADEFD